MDTLRVGGASHSWERPVVRGSRIGATLSREAPISSPRHASDSPSCRLSISAGHGRGLHTQTPVLAREGLARFTPQCLCQGAGSIVRLCLKSC